MARSLRLKSDGRVWLRAFGGALLGKAAESGARFGFRRDGVLLLLGGVIYFVECESTLADSCITRGRSQ